jgi:glutathione S-transferase
VFDGPSLTGASPKERAVIAMMNIRAESGLMNAVGAYFHHATRGLGPDLETWQCPDWGNKQKEVAQSTMAYLNEVLAENEFLAGDRFTVADITAYAGLVFAEFAKVDIPGPGVPGSRPVRRLPADARAFWLGGLINRRTEHGNQCRFHKARGH